MGGADFGGRRVRCARCGEPIGDDQPWVLDHSDVEYDVELSCPAATAGLIGWAPRATTPLPRASSSSLVASARQLRRRKEGGVCDSPGGVRAARPPHSPRSAGVGCACGQRHAAGRPREELLRRPHLCPGGASRQMRCNGLRRLRANAVVRRPDDRHVVGKIRAIALVRWQRRPGQPNCLGYPS